MSAMTVERLGDGLWRWTAPHPEWREGGGWDPDVGSVYCETPEAVVLIDPLVPADGRGPRALLAGARRRRRRASPCPSSCS